MKVLIYSHDFAPSVGGVEMTVMLLARGLAGQASARTGEASEVTVVTQTAAGSFRDEELSFRVVRRPGAGQLWRLMREAEVVHLAGPVFLPLLMGRVLRKKMVVEHHGYQAACPNGLFFYQPTKTKCPGHFLARNYGECLRCNAAESGGWQSLKMLALTFPRRWMCKRVERNLTVSDHVGERIGFPRQQTIYHGLEAITADDFVARSERGQALCIGFVGRLVAEKGLGVLLEAARRLKEQGYAFGVKLIGDGPERGRLEERKRELGLEGQVEFTGFLGGEALERALAEVDVMVMPTLMEETAGLVVMDQMRRGKAVVVSDIGGMSEVVGGAGLKFPAGDAEGLAGCLRSVLEEPGLAEALGRQARQRCAEMFRRERMIEEHREVYEELRNGAGRANGVAVATPGLARESEPEENSYRLK